MVRVHFPIYLGFELEKQICMWIDIQSKKGEQVSLDDCGIYINFEDNELATIFRLQFSL